MRSAALTQQWQRYVAGDVHHLVRGDIKQYKFHEGGFAIELAQGTNGSTSAHGLMLIV